MTLLDQIRDALTLLSTDSKRRFVTLRKSADHSLSVINSLPVHSSKEGTSQLANLQNYPDFIDPFLICCRSKSNKLASLALSALSKLILCRSISVTKLDDVIGALQDAAHQSTEVQFKILQCLPTLFENYAMDINDESLSNLLYICTIIQTSSKNSALVDTAKATLSQLITTVFEKVGMEEKKPDPDSVEYTVPVDDDKTIRVHLRAYDAQRVFNDLCTLIEHHKPSFLKTNYMTEDDGFELLESIIKNNYKIFLSHIELAYLLRIRVAPILLRFLSSCNDFTLMVRVSRLMSLLVTKELSVTTAECEVALSLMVHLISAESKTPTWKRIFCLEIYDSIFSDFSVVKQLYTTYDVKVQSRTVLNDFASTCFQIVNKQKKLLNTGDLVQPPLPPIPKTATKGKSYTSSPKEQKVFSIDGSSPKQRFMDSIDRPEPPEFPDTYILGLIAHSILLLSEGIFKASIDLARLHSKHVNLKDSHAVSFLNETHLQNPKYSQDLDEYKAIYGLTAEVWENILKLFEIYLFSTIDDKTFLHLTRSLQLLCHASGILSLKSAQSNIFHFFALATVKLTGNSGYQTKVQSFSESIAGTISSAIGQAVSNISGTAAPGKTSKDTEFQWYPRSFSSRNTTCFRVLINLAISLSEILGDSWNNLLIVLQWVSYFIDGPVGFSIKEIPAMSSLLDNHDISVIGDSLEKFTQSLAQQSSSVFYKICLESVNLSERIIHSSLKSKFGCSPMDEKLTLVPCLFNRSFYVNKLASFAELNPVRFLIQNNACWQCIISYYMKLSSDRKFDDETRLLLSRNFGSIVKVVSIKGFEDSTPDKKDDLYLSTEDKVFPAIHDYTTNLLKLPNTKEILIVDEELQMILQNLNTLKIVIDRFGNKIKHNWGSIVSILNVPFEIIARYEPDLLKESSIKALLTSILKSCFDSLKVILDELLGTLPDDQLQEIIDSLHHFVSQKYDLNLSFNAVSYFWLISDYIKETEHSLEVPSTIVTPKTQDDLILMVKRGDSEGKYTYYRSLWLYLLLILAKTSSDERAQVRNTSIITIFNVINSYSTEKPSWTSIYNLVLSPVLLHTLPDNSILTASETLQKEWIDTLENMSKNLSKLYIQHFVSFPDTVESESEIIRFWQGYMEYLTAIINLNQSWIELDEKVFEDFNSILNVFSNELGVICIPPKPITYDLFKFWTSFKIIYDLSDDSSYEDMLQSFALGFMPLYRLVSSDMTIAKFEKLIVQLDACVKFPVLIANKKDDSHCTKLQSEIIHSLSQLSFTDYHLQSLLIDQLCSISALPYATRTIIEKKLSTTKVRVPTFKSVSLESLVILDKIVESMNDIQSFINGNCISRMIKVLLEPCELKYDPRTFLPTGKSLWKTSFELILKVSNKIVEFIQTGNINNIKPQIQTQIWNYMMSAIKTCFISDDNDFKNEDFDMIGFRDLYQDITTIIISKDPQSFTKDQRDKFVEIVFQNSDFYLPDEVVNELLQSGISPENSTHRLLSMDSSSLFGTTSMLQPVHRLNLAKDCLSKLISLSEPSSGPFFKKSLQYFTLRCAYTLVRYNLDTSLLYAMPLPRLENYDVTMTLSGLAKIIVESKESSDSIAIGKCVEIMYPILVSLHTLNGKQSTLISEIFMQVQTIK